MGFYHKKRGLRVGHGIIFFQAEVKLRKVLDYIRSSGQEKMDKIIAKFVFFLLHFYFRPSY